MLDRIRMLGGNYNLVIFGDFNAHYSHQSLDTSTGIGKQLHNFIILNGLKQLISEPTRVTLSTSTTLDLLITNCSNEFLNMGTLSSPLNCDHSVIFGEMAIVFHKSHCFKRDVWDFSNVDIVNFNCELLQTDWSAIFENCFDVDIIYEKWYSIFCRIVEKYIPFKIVTIRPKDKPWMCGQVHLAIRYRAQRNRTTSLIRKAKNSYEKLNADLCDQSITSKKWWGLVKQVYDNNNKSLFSSALMENGVLITDSLDKARIFNEFFATQTNLDGADNIPPDIESFQSSMYISNIVASTQEVYS